MAKSRVGLGKQMVRAAYEQLPDKHMELCGYGELRRHISKAFDAAQAIYDASTLKNKMATPSDAVSAAMWFHSLEDDGGLDIEDVDAGCPGSLPYRVFAGLMIGRYRESIAIDPQ